MLDTATRHPTRPSTALVRYGNWTRMGEFEARITNLRSGDAVVVRTARGREWGEVLQAPVADPSGEIDGRVLRRADAVDQAARANGADERAARDLAALGALIARHAAPLRAVAVERPIGGERVVYYVEVEPGAPVEWSPLVEALRAREPDTLLEVREVGERVRPREVGCGSGGSCSSEGCRSAQAATATMNGEDAPGGAAPDGASALRPLPMAR